MRITRQACLLLLVLSMLAVVAGCSRTGSWQQRLTIVVSTPSGSVTGSSVQRITFRETNSGLAVPEARGVRTEVQGEATVVALPDGQYLFAVFDPFNSRDWPTDAELTLSAYQDVYQANIRKSYAAYARALRRTREPRVLAVEHYPMLVTFTDINDPASVVEVDPSDLSDVFGPGYAIERITLQITDDEMTKGGVAKVLSWLPGLDQNFVPTDAEYSRDVRPIETLSRHSFVRE